MRIEIQLREEDSAMLQNLLVEHGFQDVDQLFHVAIHHLASADDTDWTDEELAQAAQEGIDSGWCQGDPFESARAALREFAQKERDAA